MKPIFYGALLASLMASTAYAAKVEGHLYTTLNGEATNQVISFERNDDGTIGKQRAYVQRAAIALTEKGVGFDRIDIDLANKPDWFLAISPLGKTPVLRADDHAIFESSVILEYLEETQPNQLLPKEPIERARHRSWIEFGSAILNDIAGFYNATNIETFDQKVRALSDKFMRLDGEIAGEFFAPEGFGLVDAAFGPVFRNFDVFDEIADFGIMTRKENVLRWRAALAARPSIIGAVSEHYQNDLRDFQLRRGSHLSSIMRIVPSLD